MLIFGTKCRHALTTVLFSFHLLWSLMCILRSTACILSRLPSAVWIMWQEEKPLSAGTQGTGIASEMWQRAQFCKPVITFCYAALAPVFQGLLRLPRTALYCLKERLASSAFISMYLANSLSSASSSCPHVWSCSCGRWLGSRIVPRSLNTCTQWEGNACWLQSSSSWQKLLLPLLLQQWQWH